MQQTLNREHEQNFNGVEALDYFLADTSQLRHVIRDTPKYRETTSAVQYVYCTVVLVLYNAVHTVPVRTYYSLAASRTRTYCRFTVSLLQYVPVVHKK